MDSETEALALAREGRFSEALSLIEAAVSGGARTARALALRSSLLLQTGQAEAAFLAAEEALNAVDGAAVIWKVRGDALQALGRPAEALESYGKAMALGPQHYDPHVGAAGALRALGRYHEALAACDAALELSPGNAEARYHRGLLRLLIGDYEGGWADYQARWQVPSFVARSGAFVTPAVRQRLTTAPTREALAGRHVVVVAEQGIGDQIMFASMLPDLAEVAGQVTCVCDRRLIGLFSNAMPQVRFVDVREAPLPAGRSVEVVVAIGDLGGVFRGGPETFRGAPYLRPTEASVQHWAGRLPPREGRPRVGLSWRGGAGFTNREGRSMSLNAMAPLLSGVAADWISLQYGDVSQELAEAGSEMPVTPLAFRPDEIDDFDALAGLLANLDAVVSVQTALVHLCGALGKTCLTLIPPQPEWRYGAEGETLPWYGSVRLFRRAPEDGWEPALQQIADQLRTVA